MTTMIGIISIVLLLVNLAAIVFVLKKQSSRGETDTQSISLLNQNVQGMQQRLDTVSQGLNERLDTAARVIGSVSRELGTMQEIGRNMQALQDFLKSPKLRGNIGEQVLRQMLEQNFPRQMFDLQYSFNDGKMVDAIVRSEEGIIPIDSKFPMENYQRMVQQEEEAERERVYRDFRKDVKKHVTDIAKKYILPAEGTVDFAIMYIPSETVYYEIIKGDDELNNYALEQKVLFVSPNSFYYFMRILMMGMRERQVAEATKDILKIIRGIQKDAEKFGATLGVLNTHVTNAKSALDRATTDYAKLEGKIEKIDDIDDAKLLD